MKEKFEAAAAEAIAERREKENIESGSPTEGERTCDHDGCEREVKVRRHPKPENDIEPAAATVERVCPRHDLQ